MIQNGGLAGLGGMSSGSWVDDLYATHFGREADAEGRDYWLNSGLDQDAVAAQFAAAPEAQRRAYIQGVYQEMFGRPADDEGLNYWQNSGVDKNDIYSAFNATPEARIHAIQDMYRDYLGRDADEDGLSYWDSSDLDEYGIANALWDSPEAQEHLAQQQAQYGPFQPWMQPLAPLENGATRDNIQMMYDLLRPHYTDNALAGWFASSAVESYLNPQQLQLDGRGQPIIKADGTPRGKGHFQWGNERLWGIDPGNKSLGLYKFAEQHGLDPLTTEGQIRFKLYEMYANPYYARWRNDINNAKTAADAARIATKRYMAAGEPHMDRRVKLANQFLPWIQQGAPPDAPFIREILRPQMPLDPPLPPPRPADIGRQTYYSPQDMYGPGYVDPYAYGGAYGQSIDPMTGQWSDPWATGINGGLQPTMVADATPDNWGYGPIGGQSSGDIYTGGLTLTPYSSYGAGPVDGVGGQPGNNWPGAGSGAFESGGWGGSPTGTYPDPPMLDIIGPGGGGYL
jgi:hypothetical protein